MRLTRRQFVAGLGALASVATPRSGAAQAALPAWPAGVRSSMLVDGMAAFRGGPRRDFYGSGPLRDTLAPLWTAPLGTFTSTWPDGSPRPWTGTGWTGQPLVWGGRVWVGALDSHLYCWDATSGVEIWRASADRMFKGSACLLDGRIFAPNVDNHVRAFDAGSGVELWRHDTTRDCDSSPVVHDGVLYVAGESGYVRALDLGTGSLLWSVEVGGHEGPPGSCGAESSVALDGDQLFVANYSGQLHCISLSQRAIVWTADTRGDTDASPVLDDRFVYAASEPPTPRLGCWRRTDGALVWAHDSNTSGYWATPALDGGRLFAGSDDGVMTAHDATTGRVLWEYQAGGAIWSSPCVVDQKVVFGSRDGSLYQLDAITGALRGTATLDGTILSTPAIVGGRLYVGTCAGTFWCLG